MEAVTGVFSSRSDAERALALLRSTGVPEKQVSLLTPQSIEANTAPIDATEQPGMAKAIGAVIGGSAGLTGSLVLAAIIPGVGPITAIGLLGAALVTAAGAKIGAVAGEKLEDSMSEGLPEDELFVYEDALRKGRSVVVVLAEDETAASRFRELLRVEGAESVDAAREQWWIGLRSAEKEHYSTLGRSFHEDEKFYRLGFEAALHARTRCKEYDQVMSEMSMQIEDLEKQYPGKNATEPFTHGYERGRDYYQTLCSESKAA
jgi:outer membrane lipoprotein SlyB